MQLKLTTDEIDWLAKQLTGAFRNAASDEESELVLNLLVRIRGGGDKISTTQRQRQRWDPIPPETIKSILADHNAGMGGAGISRKHGIAAPTVYNLIVKYKQGLLSGDGFTGERKTYRKVTKEMTGSIIADREAGLTTTLIASRYLISRQSVYNTFQQHDAATNSSHPNPSHPNPPNQPTTPPSSPANGQTPCPSGNRTQNPGKSPLEGQTRLALNAGLQGKHTGHSSSELPK